MSRISFAFAVAFGFAVLASQAQAVIVTSTGAGSAVTTVDRSTTFDDLNASGIDLTSYSSGTLFATVPDTNFEGFNAFNDPGRTTQFHYGNGGNTSFVTIAGTDDVAIQGVEFLYGHGGGGVTGNLVWETRLNGVTTGSGLITGVSKNTVVGWFETDATGFDQLFVAGGPSATAFGQFQSIALDNLNVQLAPVPEPSSVALMAFSAMGVVVFVRRKRKQSTETESDS